jgi:histone H4
MTASASPEPARRMGKRHRAPHRAAPRPALSKPEITRLARRGGIRRLSATVYEEARTVLRQFLAKLLYDTRCFTEHAKRKTVTAMDVVMALKHGGQSSWHTILYGFDGPTLRRRARARPPPASPTVPGKTDAPMPDRVPAPSGPDTSAGAEHVSAPPDPDTSAGADHAPAPPDADADHVAAPSEAVADHSADTDRVPVPSDAVVADPTAGEGAASP